MTKLGVLRTLKSKKERDRFAAEKRKEGYKVKASGYSKKLKGYGVIYWK